MNFFLIEKPQVVASHNDMFSCKQCQFSETFSNCVGTGVCKANVTALFWTCSKILWSKSIFVSYYSRQETPQYNKPHVIQLLPVLRSIEFFVAVFVFGENPSLPDLHFVAFHISKEDKVNFYCVSKFSVKTLW